MSLHINKCPYCGEIPELKGYWAGLELAAEQWKNMATTYNVVCRCKVAGPVHAFETKAISLWNMMQVKDYSEQEEEV